MRCAVTYRMDLLPIMFLVTVLELISVGSAARKPIAYAGPILYSAESPPSLLFNGPLTQIQSREGKLGKKNKVEYVPLPPDDLPVLIYQGDPPVHILNSPSSGRHGGSIPSPVQNSAVPQGVYFPVSGGSNGQGAAPFAYSGHPPIHTYGQNYQTYPEPATLPTEDDPFKFIKDAGKGISDFFKDLETKGKKLLKGSSQGYGYGPSKNKDSSKAKKPTSNGYSTAKPSGSSYPTSTYSPISSTYAPVSSTYSATPARLVSSTSNTYVISSTGYSAPSSTYGPPSASYGAPSSAYGPPKGNKGGSFAGYPLSDTSGMKKPSKGFELSSLFTFPSLSYLMEGYGHGQKTKGGSKSPLSYIEEIFLGKSDFKGYPHSKKPNSKPLQKPPGQAVAPSSTYGPPIVSPSSQPSYLQPASSYASPIKPVSSHYGPPADSYGATPTKHQLHGGEKTKGFVGSIESFFDSLKKGLMGSSKPSGKYASGKPPAKQVYSAPNSVAPSVSYSTPKRNEDPKFDYSTLKPSYDTKFDYSTLKPSYDPPQLGYQAPINSFNDFGNAPLNAPYPPYPPQQSFRSHESVSPTFSPSYSASYSIQTPYHQANNQTYYNNLPINYYPVAPPSAHKPPIIIYQGIQPPVNVYSSSLPVSQPSYPQLEIDSSSNTQEYPPAPEYVSNLEGQINTGYAPNAEHLPEQFLTFESTDNNGNSNNGNQNSNYVVNEISESIVIKEPDQVQASEYKYSAPEIHAPIVNPTASSIGSILSDQYVSSTARLSDVEGSSSESDGSENGLSYLPETFSPEKSNQEQDKQEAPVTADPALVEKSAPLEDKSSR